MPSSTTDIVKSVLSQSLGGTHHKGQDSTDGDNLDSRLTSANKLSELIRQRVGYEEAQFQHANALDTLRSKYVVLATKTVPVAPSIIKPSPARSTYGNQNGVVRNGNLNGFSNGHSNNNTPNSNNTPNGTSNGKHEVTPLGFKVKTNGNLNGSHHGAANGIKSPSPSTIKANGAVPNPAFCDSLLPTPSCVLYPAENVHLGWKNMFKVGAGMVNMGNTCYLNATLQALFHVPALVYWLLGDGEHLRKCEQVNGPNHGDCITCSMTKTLRAAHSKHTIRPDLIANKLKLICRHMNHGSQEDAHEFMRYLLENMEKAFLKRTNQKLDVHSQVTTPINQIFGGYMRTEVKCQKCGAVSATVHYFQDLILDIRKAGKVEEALDLYFSREKLDSGESSYKCEKCKNLVPATKKFSIERPPKTLCIQLKRFNVSGVKMNKQIEHPLGLNLRKYLSPKSIYATSNPISYHLVSMVTHSGQSAGCGHYTAVAKASNQAFYVFDDQQVQEISQATVLNRQAYILLYELKSAVNGLAKPLPKSSTVTSNPFSTHSVNNSSSPSNGVLSPFHIRNQNSQVGENVPPRPRLVARPKKAEFSRSSPNGHGPSVPSVINGVNGGTKPTPFIGPVLPNGTKTSEKRASLVPYELEDSSSRESSLSPPLEEAKSTSLCENETENSTPLAKTRSETDTSIVNNGTTTETAKNGDRSNTNPVDDLLRNSHQGYEPSRVRTWSGERSCSDKSSEKSSPEQRKRPYDEYETELDKGRTKKVRRENTWSHSANAFKRIDQGSYNSTPHKPFYQKSNRYDRNSVNHYHNNFKTYFYNPKGKHKVWPPRKRSRY